MLAQIIQLLASPILTRVFDPIEIGALTVFLAFSQAVLPAIGAKLEIAMVLPRSERNARILLGMALRTNVLISLGLVLVCLFPASSLFKNEDADRLSDWVWMIPLYTWIAGNVVILQYALNRAGAFRKLGAARVLVAVGTVTLSIGLGLLGMGLGGLIIGAFAGQLLTMIALLIWNRSSIGIWTINWTPRHRALLKKYRDFPVMNATSSLLDGFRTAMPVLTLGWFFPGDVAGWYGLMYRVAAAPISVISIAVSQVNLREVAEIVRNGGNARKHVLKIGGTLWLITILPLVIVLIWGPDLFAMIFGSEWREAGEYMRLMAPAFAARVVASPLSTTIGATQNNLLGMSWKVLAFTTNLIVLLSLAYGGDPKTVILGLGISDFCLYLLYQAMIFHAAGKPRPA